MTELSAESVRMSEACASGNHYRCNELSPDCQCPRCHAVDSTLPAEYVRQPDIAPCPGSGRKPLRLSPAGGMGECMWCHGWHGVYPVKGTVHRHAFKLSDTLDLLPPDLLPVPTVPKDDPRASAGNTDRPAHSDGDAAVAQRLKDAGKLGPHYPVQPEHIDGHDA